MQSAFALILFLSALPGARAAGSEACPNTICRIVWHGRIGDLRWPDFADFRSRLLEFYGPSFAPAWLENGAPSARARAMMALLKAADLHGLEPQDYDADLWEKRFSELERSQFDVGLTVALMRYLADLHYGKANPGFFHLGSARGDFDIAAFLRNRLRDAADANALIASDVEPKYAAYKRTRQALEAYLRLAGQAEAKVSAPKTTIEEPALEQRLRQLGDLAGREVPEAIKHFQSRHGLEADGRLGKATIEALNIPLAQRVRQLRLALERWRWLPHTFSHSPIVVNIPEFTLRTLDAQLDTDLEMKVVVGSAYENETPVFAAELTYITFRPYWNVPRSILLNEMAATLEEDPGYFNEHGYQLVRGEKAIATQNGLTEAELKGLLAGRYRMRQLPGPGNALGLIRFGLPNEHNVYLHGTPSQRLFGEARRDYSHGCVRVERPVELAQWCLRETGGWTPARILRAMNGARTFAVYLKKPIPVLLTYATATVGRDHEPHFASDIYRQDALLENRLAQGYPSRLATSDAK